MENFYVICNRKDTCLKLLFLADLPIPWKPVVIPDSSHWASLRLHKIWRSRPGIHLTCYFLFWLPWNSYYDKILLSLITYFIQPYHKKFGALTLTANQFLTYLVQNKVFKFHLCSYYTFFLLKLIQLLVMKKQFLKNGKRYNKSISWECTF